MSAPRTGITRGREYVATRVGSGGFAEQRRDRFASPPSHLRKAGSRELPVELSDEAVVLIVLRNTFNFEMSGDEFAAVSRERALRIAQVPGLRWKLWLTDGETRTHSGVYLFDDQASAEAYLNGELVTNLRNNPRIKNLETIIFGIDEEASRITRAPIGTEPTDEPPGPRY